MGLKNACRDYEAACDYRRKAREDTLPEVKAALAATGLGPTDLDEPPESWRLFDVKRVLP